jgi:hypothetical protein
MLFFVPYAPECVEGEFSEAHMQHPAWINPTGPGSWLVSRHGAQ